MGPYGVSARGNPGFVDASLELLDANEGLFGAADLGLVKAHVTNRITSGTPIGRAFTAPVRVPVASLNWTVSPRFELGYRLPEGGGDVRLGYRFLAASGSESGLSGELKSRLDVSVFDLDYVSSEWLARDWSAPFRDLRLVAGVRLAASCLDSSARGEVIADRFSSHFAGAGPHVGLEFSKWLPGCPLEIYTRADAAGLLGRTRQSFATRVRDENGNIFGAARRDDPQSNGAAAVSAAIGLAWRPDPGGRFRAVLGYQFEQWWDLGRTDDSNFELTVQGAFLRAEWRY